MFGTAVSAIVIGGGIYLLGKVRKVKKKRVKSLLKCLNHYWFLMLLAQAFKIIISKPLLVPGIIFQPRALSSDIRTSKLERGLFILKPSE